MLLSIIVKIKIIKKIKKKCECFSFLFGGDMMMIAKWDGEKWIS